MGRDVAPAQLGSAQNEPFRVEVNVDAGIGVGEEGGAVVNG